MKKPNIYTKRFNQSVRQALLSSGFISKSKVIRIGLGSMLTLAAVCVLFLQGCKKEEFTERTNYELLIGEYLQENPNEFSTFYEVLEKSNTIAFLKAYGAYTVYAPTNDAFAKYFQEKGKSGVSDFTEEELKDLVRYHTIEDTIATTMFIDGKMQTPTMYGQYLTSKVDYDEEEGAVYKINKYATLKMKDKRLLNGVFHSVESVLDPVTQTLTDLISDNPDYSIFYQALEETGYDDTLNLKVEKGDADPRWFTVIAVTDEAYAKDGINSYADLLEKYSDTGDPSNPLDSLNLYVGYHCLDNQLKYITDLQSAGSHVTMAPLEVVTIRTIGDTVKVNEDIFDGAVEPGYALNRRASDNTANNGVLHVVENDFNIKVRFPMPVYWEVSDQLEIRKMPGVYKSQSVELEAGQLENITWPEGNSIWYNVGSINGSQCVQNDYLSIYLRPEVIPWIEFTTPILVKGTYKVWICTRNVYPSSGRRMPIYFVYFNDNVMPVIIDNNITMGRGSSEEEWELQGLKWYTFRPAADSTEYRYINSKDAASHTGQLAGTIEVPTTGTHKIKFVGISAYSGQTIRLDQIQFIPTDMDQIWPRRNNDDNTDIFKDGLPPEVIPE
ncbi:fasciclin domain-containing protein [Plebeiibacterium marinum]|uniref:Fasciclin domain-containing protein n=1 Tax=Plebeiibacterium marinum TaxID=2992111 RepID=A0AAE3SLR9_9BACT|nr:fasciclin domain-containing protein [Plebeiobacterium marinum]MCW3807759.1 fasciclin domain-containing protein [Plebeiobacterium marinum]